MAARFPHMLRHLLFILLLSVLWNGEAAGMTRQRLVPRELPRSAFNELSNEREYGVFRGRREKQSANWNFDFSRDPNFEDLLESDSLKSAILTLNLYQDELAVTAPELTENQTLSGIDREENHRLAIHTTAKIEVELLDIYSAEDLLKLFSQQAGRLPVSYHDPEQISSVELHLITEKPKLSTSVILLITSGVLMISILLGHVARRKFFSKQDTVPEQGHHKRLAAVGEQTSTVIHDVKNSFAAIRGCAEIIADDSLDPQERKEFVELIVNEIDRGVYMTQELLEFSRGRKPALQLQSVFLHKLLDQTLTLLRAELQASGIQLNCEIHDTEALQLDPEKMRRVFINLISNAKEAMPEGGCLTIRSARHDNHILVEFLDNGCGMPPEVAEKIFEPFMTRGKASGTGLGMAIVKDIIDAHHATINVESVENQGSCFQIVLPI